jgi:hypothetical protein
LRHRESSFKTGINKTGWTRHHCVCVIEFLVDTRLILRIKGLDLSGLTLIEKLAGHSGVDADTERALQFASSHTHFNALRDIDYDLLGAVEVCGALTFVLCLLNSSFFIAFIEFLDDVCVQLLDSLLERG